MDKPFIDLSRQREASPEADTSWMRRAIETIGWEGVSQLTRRLPGGNSRVVRRWSAGTNRTPPLIEAWLKRLEEGHREIGIPAREEWTRDPRPAVTYPRFRPSLSIIGWNLQAFCEKFGATREEASYFATAGSKISQSIVDTLEALRRLHEENPAPHDWWGDGGKPPSSA